MVKRRHVITALIFQRHFHLKCILSIGELLTACRHFDCHRKTVKNIQHAWGKFESDYVMLLRTTFLG